MSAQALDDSRMGMLWWNAASQATRARWLAESGSAVPALAWECFKRSSARQHAQQHHIENPGLRDAGRHRREPMNIVDNVSDFEAALASMDDIYKDALREAEKAPTGHQSAYLIRSLEDVNRGCVAMAQVVDAAHGAVGRDDNAGVFTLEALLKGAQALNAQQSSRIWELTGLVLLLMREHAVLPRKESWIPPRGH